MNLIKQLLMMLSRFVFKLILTIANLFDLNINEGALQITKYDALAALADPEHQLSGHMVSVGVWAYNEDLGLSSGVWGQNPWSED